MRSYRTGLCGTGTQIKNQVIKELCRAVLHQGDSLSLENLSEFSVSVDPERILTNFSYSH